MVVGTTLMTNESYDGSRQCATPAPFPSTLLFSTRQTQYSGYCCQPHCWIFSSTLPTLLPRSPSQRARRIVSELHWVLGTGVSAGFGLAIRGCLLCVVVANCNCFLRRKSTISGILSAIRRHGRSIRCYNESQPCRFNHSDVEGICEHAPATNGNAADLTCVAAPARA